MASDVYYVNQDKKDNQKAQLKGGAYELAVKLRTKEEEIYKKRQEDMRIMADKRKEEMEKYHEAEAKKKEDIKLRKASLKKV